MKRRTAQHSRRAVIKGAGLSLAGLATASVIGCASRKPGHEFVARSSGGQAASPVAGGTLNTYETSNLPSLDVQATSSFFTQRVAAAVMSRLFRFRTGPDVSVAAAFQLESDLAASRESPDAITWTFRLRKGTSYPNIPPLNGRAVDAEDIKATFTRAVTKADNPNRGIVDMIDPAQIETPAPDTVVFKLKYRYGAFAELLASEKAALIYPKEVQSGGYDPTKQILGSGPFTFDRYTPDVGVSLKKNPHWFESGLPYVDAAQRAFVPDAAQQRAQFTAGNLDLLTVESQNLAGMQQQNPKAALLTTPPSPCLWIFGQLGRPGSWQDIRVRRAVSLALNRDAISHVIFGGKSDTYMFLNGTRGKWALKLDQLDPQTAQYYTDNIAMAKQLLQEAGVTDRALKLIYPNNAYGPEFNTSAETIHSMLASAGFKITLVPVDYQKDWVAAGKGIRYGGIETDAIAVGVVADSTTMDQVLFDDFHSTSTLNNSKLSDPVLDAMIETTRGLVDDNQRLNACLDIQKYVADKAYIVGGIPKGYVYQMLQPRVQNFQPALTHAFFTETYAKLWLSR